MKRSAGVIPYRVENAELQVLLVHPGGPFWSRRDLGAWSIAKGEYEPPETADAAARREFEEETGLALTGALIPLGEARQPSGKRVTAFAADMPFDLTRLKSNVFEMEWPPKSGQRQTFPEIDRAEWFGMTAARQHILPGQAVFLDRLTAHLAL